MKTLIELRVAVFPARKCSPERLWISLFRKVCKRNPPIGYEHIIPKCFETCSSVKFWRLQHATIPRVEVMFRCISTRHILPKGFETYFPERLLNIFSRKVLIHGSTQVFSPSSSDEFQNVFFRLFRNRLFWGCWRLEHGVILQVKVMLRCNFHKKDVPERIWPNPTGF